MKRRDHRSPEAADYHRLYNSARWRSIRGQQLAREPLCAICITIGQIGVADVVDHVEPHRGDPAKFWGGPFQSLCSHHHNSTKQSLEKGGAGLIKGSDADGWPLDPNHAWRRR